MPATAKKTVAPVKPTALAKKDAFTDALKKFGDAPRYMSDGFTMLANMLSADLAAPVLAPLYSDMKRWEENLEELTKNVRNRILAFVQSEGKPTEEGSLSKTAIAGEYELRIQPRRTGLDDKKVEAMLRAKGIDPHKHMQATVTYKVDDDKLTLLKGQGKLTEDEVEACRYELAYNVMSPKKV